MSFSALLYTAAAIGFFILMINRPAVDVPGTTDQTTTTATAEQTNSAGQLTISATGQATSATDGTAQAGATMQADSGATAQPDTGAATQAADGTMQSSETTAQATDADANQTETATEASNDSTEQSGTALAGAAAATTAAATSGAQSAASASKADYTRERRLSNRARDAITEGDILFVNDGSRNFLAVQTNASATPASGGVVVLHNNGLHPDWEDTINPLRTGLSKQGWTTLSLQMPVLGQDADNSEYASLATEAGKRIDAGIKHLKEQGLSPIVIAAHGGGAELAMQWVDSQGDIDIAAFVGLGMGAADAQQAVSKMQTPVFDLYGANDNTGAEMAAARWQLITAAGNPQSEQRALPEADLDFKGKGDELVELVATWLNGLNL